MLPSKAPPGQHLRASGFTFELRQLLAAAVAVCGLTACGGSDDISPVSIAYATISQGSNSRVNLSVEFLGLVARTETEWAALWSQHSTGRSPPFPIPSVDFRRLMVIGVFLGGRPDGCYGISVQDVLLSSREVEVLYREESPVVGEICSAAVVLPYQMISIQATTLPVRFRKI